MKIKLTVLTLLIVAGLPAQQAAVPRVMHFVGVLKDAAGRPQTGMLEVDFSLYVEQQGGAPLWSETQAVPLDEHGGYAVLLGATQPAGLPVEAFSSGKVRWLAVTPRLPGAVEQPRIALAGVPYAFKAMDAETLGGLPASAFLRADVPSTAAAVAPVMAPLPQSLGIQGGVQPDACTKLNSGGAAKAGQVAKFTAPCTIAASAIWESGGSVGIGTSTPSATLEILGDAEVVTPAVTSGSGSAAISAMGADTFDAASGVLPGPGITATGGTDRSTSTFANGGFGVLATGGTPAGAGAGGSGLKALGGSAGAGGAGGYGVEAYGSNASGAANPGGSGVFGSGGAATGADQLAGDGILGLGGSGSSDRNSYGGGSGLEGVGGYGGSGGATGGFGVRATGGFDVNGNQAPAGFFQGQVWVFSAGGPSSPQSYLEQETATDYARQRFLVASASSYWDIAVGGGTQPVMNFFRSGVGNVMALTPGASDLLVMSNGAKLTKGGTWTNASDRNKKMDFREVDTQDVLRRIGDLPITTWSYREEGSDVRHIGPMAQDFRAAFGLGEDDQHIATVDADGVAMAALQALYRENRAKDNHIRELEDRLGRLEERLAAMEVARKGR